MGPDWREASEVNSLDVDGKGQVAVTCYLEMKGVVHREKDRNQEIVQYVLDMRATYPALSKTNSFIFPNYGPYRNQT